MRAGFLVIAVAACSFDTSGAGGSASVGMSIGEAGSDPSSEGGAHTEESGATIGASVGSVDDTSSTGVVECGGADCVPGAPQGWAGPFAISQSSPPMPEQACAQGWTEHAYAWRELHADPATCSCACTPVGGECTIAASYFSDAGCTTQVASGSSSGDCKDMYTESDHSYARMTGTAVGTGCTPAPTNVVPPVAWTEGVLLCAPPHGDSCDGGSCVPATPAGFDDARWCVSAIGEQACPDATYAHALVVHQSVADTRDCTACTCTMPSEPTCAGTVDQFFQPLCFIPGPGVAVDGACHSSGVNATNAWSFEYDGTPPSYACGGNPSLAIGEATAADPMTICCTA